MKAKIVFILEYFMSNNREAGFVLRDLKYYDYRFVIGFSVWLVTDFEALPCQVTTTFDMGCAARVRTAPAFKYTVFCRLLFFDFISCKPLSLLSFRYVLAFFAIFLCVLALFI